MPIPIFLLICNFFATAYMVGLIWMVQVVHYPLFAMVGREEFPEYQKMHQWLTTIVVGPPMLIEAFTAILLAWFPPKGVDYWMIIVGIVLVLVIWASTALLQVPCHGQLEKKFDSDVHFRLVSTNWLRTVAWTARGILAAWMTANVIASR